MGSATSAAPYRIYNIGRGHPVKLVDFISILEKELGEVSDKLYITTDDGSYKKKGFTTDILKELLDDPAGRFDIAFAIGPVPMMKAVCDVTKVHNIKTIVSLNSNMVDATGMCGTCRVTVGGHTRFACVDGPEFDGHQVDFNELMARNNRFIKQEKESLELFKHKCKLEKMGAAMVKTVPGTSKTN